MFTKTTTNNDLPLTKPATPSLTAPAPARRPGPSAVSLVASDLFFEGNISGSGELLIEGSLKGDVQVARLVVGEQARVEGSLKGDVIDIRGHVFGDIQGKAVRILQTAHVEGDVLSEQLSIEAGAYFQGRCQPFKAATSNAATEASGLDLTDGQGADIIELDQAAQR